MFMRLYTTYRFNDDVSGLSLRMGVNSNSAFIPVVTARVRSTRECNVFTSPAHRGEEAEDHPRLSWPSPGRGVGGEGYLCPGCVARAECRTTFLLDNRRTLQMCHCRDGLHTT